MPSGVHDVITYDGGAVHTVGDLRLEREQVRVHLIRERLHGRDEQLRGEVRDVHAHLLGGDGKGYVQMLVHVYRNAAFRDILYVDARACELVRRELCRTTDGDGVADAGYKFTGIVAVHKTCHDRVVAQHHQCLARDNIGSENCVFHTL